MTASAWLTLLMAAFTSSLLYVILKFFHRFKANNLQGLMINYFTAGSTALLMNRSQGFQHPQDFAVPGFIIGLLFIVVFYITALTTQKCGVAVTSIAGKMSMVIPITAGLIIFHDQLTWVKSAGIVIAVAAVYLSTISPENNAKQSSLWLPLLLFLGSGMVDTSIKLAQHYFISENNFQSHISYIFYSAGIAGICIVAYRYLRFKESFVMASIPAGIILGVTNYFSLEFLIRCLAYPGVESSLVFALVNLLVVVFSAVFAFTLFREKPSRANLTGIALAMVAILFLNYS